MKPKISAATIILIIVVGFMPVHSQKLAGIGLNAGYVLPINHVDKGLSVELSADMGEVLKYLFLQPSITYRQIDRNRGEETVDERALTFGTKFIGYFNNTPKGFYAGVGVYFNRITTELTNETDPDLKSDIHTKLGFNILTGYLFKFKKVSVYLEPCYQFIHGGFSNLQIKAGLFYLL